MTFLALLGAAAFGLFGIAVLMRGAEVIETGFERGLLESDRSGGDKLDGVQLGRLLSTSPPLADQTQPIENLSRLGRKPWFQELRYFIDGYEFVVRRHGGVDSFPTQPVTTTVELHGRPLEGGTWTEMIDTTRLSPIERRFAPHFDSYQWVSGRADRIGVELPDGGGEEAVADAISTLVDRAAMGGLDRYMFRERMLRRAEGTEAVSVRSRERYRNLVIRELSEDPRTRVVARRAILRDGPLSAVPAAQLLCPSVGVKGTTISDDQRRACLVHLFESCATPDDQRALVVEALSVPSSVLQHAAAGLAFKHRLPGVFDELAAAWEQTVSPYAADALCDAMRSLAPERTGAIVARSLLTGGPSRQDLAARALALLPIEHSAQYIGPALLAGSPDEQRRLFKTVGEFAGREWIPYLRTLTEHPNCSRKGRIAIESAIEGIAGRDGRGRGGSLSLAQAASGAGDLSIADGAAGMLSVASELAEFELDDPEFDATES